MQKALTVIGLHIIRFAAITEQVFSFRDGVNVIYGENRSGKTTLCEFIRFMYYGFEGRDPQDYYPYGSDNRSVCGSMTVKYGAREIEIFREKGVQGEVIAVTDTEKGAPLDIGKKTPGEYFLGVTSALYDKSLYCPQDMAGLVSSGDLINYEKELICAYSGEESFSELPSALEKRKAELKNPDKTGKIDIALAEREQLDGDLAAAIVKQNEIINIESVIAETSSKLLEAEKKIVLAKADIESLHEMHVDENLRHLAEAENDCAQKRENYEKLARDAVEPAFLAQAESDYAALCKKSEELETLETRLANTKSNLDLHTEMIDTGEYDEETLEDVSCSLENRAKAARGLVIFALPTFAVSAVALAVLYAWLKLPLNLSLGISGGILALSLSGFIAAAALMLSKRLLYRSVGMTSAEEFEEAYETMRSLSQTTDLYRSTYQDEARAFKEYASDYSAALAQLARKLSLNADAVTLGDIAKRIDALRTAAELARRAEEEYKAAEKRLNELGTSGKRSKDEQNAALLRKRERELSWYTNQREALFEKKRSLEEIFSTAVIHTERPVYIKTRLDELNARLAEYTRDYDALNIAAEVLDDALGVMRFRIKDHLADGVNHNIKFALKENESFLVDDNYSLQYKNSSRLIPVFTDSVARSSRAAKGISRSLCEMAAISLRLALVELLETDTAAAVLDEPFAFIDPEGEEKMIKKLANSNITQVFLFTSHHVPHAEEKYNLLKLNF